MSTSATLPLDQLLLSGQDPLPDEDTPLSPYHSTHRPSQSTHSSSDRTLSLRDPSANHHKSPSVSRQSSSSQRGRERDGSNEDGNESTNEDQGVSQPPCQPLLYEHSSPEPVPTPPQQTRSNWRAQPPLPATFDGIPPPSTSSSLEPRQKPTQVSSWKLEAQHPKYLHNAWKYLLSVPGGMEWQELLKHHVQFEKLAPNDVSWFCASSALCSLST